MFETNVYHLTEGLIGLTVFIGVSLCLLFVVDGIFERKNRSYGEDHQND